MKLTRSDIDKIKQYYDESKETFEDMEEAGGDPHEYFANLDKEKNGKKESSRDDALKKIGEYLRVNEISTMAEEGNPFFSVSDIGEQLAKDLNLEPAYLDVAFGAIMDESIQKSLPVNEEDPLGFDAMVEMAKVGREYTDEELKTAFTESINAKEAFDIGIEKTISESEGLEKQCTERLFIDGEQVRMIRDASMRFQLKIAAKTTGFTANVDEIMEDFSEKDMRKYELLQRASEIDEKESGALLNEEEKQEKQDVLRESREIAGQKIAAYQRLKQLKATRTFFDKVFHPFRTYSEYKAEKNMANELYADYNLSPENLASIQNLMQSMHNVDNATFFDRRHNKLHTSFINPAEMDAMIADFREKSTVNFDENALEGLDELPVDNEMGQGDIEKENEALHEDLNDIFAPESKINPENKAKTAPAPVAEKSKQNKGISAE